MSDDKLYKVFCVFCAVILLCFALPILATTCTVVVDLWRSI